MSVETPPPDDTEVPATSTIASGPITDSMVADTAIPHARHVELKAALVEDSTFSARYETGALIGEGGMGEVRLIRDRRLGREVAVKVIRSKYTGRLDVESRFVREACVQGQLEHPSIVPVYDLGLTPDGQAFFTMKRINGLTLDEIIRGLKEKDPDITNRYSRRKLLTAFAAVCLTIDFAHSRGVLHRDLKPGNLMLGDFGEVYVIDWGIAKLIEDDAHRDLQSSSTVEGAILGTPGYMAPEQLNGGGELLHPQADIYGLGAILFELLALESLHPRDTLTNTVKSTLKGVDARPSLRRGSGDVPPELDEICLRATALEPKARYQSARELSDAIERYLDGDRDLALRREASVRHTEAADAALARALDPNNTKDEHQDRAVAVRELSHALALDAQNARAVRSMVRLILEPPRTLPIEAKEAIERVHLEAKRSSAKFGAFGLLAILLSSPALFWMGVTDVRPLLAGFVIVLSMIGVSVVSARMVRVNKTRRNVIFGLGMALVLVSTRLFGPLMIAPGLATTFVLPMVINAARSERLPMMMIGASMIVGPMLLEVLNVLPASYVFENGMMGIVPRMVQFPPVATLFYLSFWGVMQIVIPAMFGLRIHEKFTEAEDRLQLHAWYLRQLVPDTR